MTVVRASTTPMNDTGIDGLGATEALNADAGSGALTAGVFVLSPANELPMHRHRIEEGFYVVDGSGTFMIRDVEHMVSRGDFLLAPAWAPHGFRTSANETLRVVYVYPAHNPWTEML